MHTVETREGKATSSGTLWGKIKGIFTAPIPTKKHTIIFWDDPVELPYRRYHKYNKHYMIAMDVGNTVEDYDRRQSRAIKYLNADNKKAASTELTNQRQCLHNAIEEYNPLGMALATMVHSIDGHIYTSFQEDSLNDVLDRLEEIGFNKWLMDTTLEHVKKK